MSETQVNDPVLDSLEARDAADRQDAEDREKEKLSEPMPAPLKLNLGCGNRFADHPGFVAVDINAACDPKPDVICDLSKAPWPWDDNSVDEVVSEHFLEHIPGIAPRDSRVDTLIKILLNQPFFKDDERERLNALFNPPNEGRMTFFNELWRVMKVGAEARFQVPYYASMRAVQDPTHTFPPICDTTFLYVNKKWREENKLTQMPITCNFDFSIGYAMDPNEPRGMSNRTDDIKRQWIRNDWNVVLDLIAVLKKIE